MPFRYKSYYNLKNNLGRFDILIEVNEISLREFITNAVSSENPINYVKSLSEKHSIKVDTVDFEELQLRISQLYILSIFQQFEEFLENYRDEHPGRNEWEYIKDKTLFDNILINIAGSFQEGIKLLGSLNYELFDYYRLVRNKFLHTEIDTKKIDNKAQLLFPKTQTNLDYCKLNAPSIYNELSFDDFILFSRVCKKIAEKFCDIGKPTESEMIDIIKHIYHKKYKKELITVLAKSNNKKRLLNSLKTILRIEHGLTPVEAEKSLNSIFKEPVA